MPPELAAPVSWNVTVPGQFVRVVQLAPVVAAYSACSASRSVSAFTSFTVTSRTSSSVSMCPRRSVTCTVSEYASSVPGPRADGVVPV